MKTKHITIALIILLVIIAVFTNPATELHKEKVRGELKAYMQKSMAEKGSDDTGTAFANLLGGVLVDRIVDNAITTDSFVLFSITKISWQGEEKRIGFGAFGNVWLSRDVNKALNENNETEM